MSETPTPDEMIEAHRLAVLDWEGWKDNYKPILKPSQDAAKAELERSASYIRAALAERDTLRAELDLFSKQARTWEGRASEAESQAYKATVAQLTARLTAEAELAEARALIKKTAHVLARAFDRIHCLPRTSDTELANEISATIAALAKEQPR